MVDMVDMASATATMASVMLSPRLMLIPTTMVDMALAMEGLTMVDMVDMDSMAITAKLYLILSICDLKFEMYSTLLIIYRKSSKKKKKKKKKKVLYVKTTA